MSQGVESLVSHSASTPVLFVFLMEDEPPSEYIVGQMETLGDLLSKSAITTDVDCTFYPEICVQFNVTSFPTFILVHSPNTRYNIIYKGNGSVASLEAFVRSNAFPGPPPQLSFPDLNNLLSSIGGSSIVSISGFSSDVLFAQAINRFAPSFGPSLVSVESPVSELRVHVSPKCSIPYKGEIKPQAALDFVYDHRFSALHHYSLEEMISFLPSSQMILIVTRNGLRSENKEILAELSSHYCGDAAIGWMKRSEDPRIDMSLGLQPDDATSLIVVDRQKGIAKKMNRELTLEHALQFCHSILDLPEEPGPSEGSASSVVAAALAIASVTTLIWKFDDVYSKFLDKVCGG